MGGPHRLGEPVTHASRRASRRRGGDRSPVRAGRLRRPHAVRSRSGADSHQASPQPHAITAPDMPHHEMPGTSASARPVASGEITAPEVDLSSLERVEPRAPLSPAADGAEAPQGSDAASSSGRRSRRSHRRRWIGDRAEGHRSARAVGDLLFPDGRPGLAG